MMSDRKTNTVIVLIILLTLLAVWWVFKSSVASEPSIQQAITTTDSAKKEVKTNAEGVQSNRTKNDNYITAQKQQAVQSLPSSDDIDALVILANDIIRRGRENRLSDSTDVRVRPVGTPDPES